MRLKKLGCQYFMHFGSYSEIEFPEDYTIMSITGQWANEPKRSNRSGKSSLVEAMLYGLYGKSRAKKEIGLINKNYPDENMVVELTFDNNGEDIVIQRGRTNTNQIILELTGFEGADKKVVQDEINRLVGLSYDDFIMTSFFIQGDIHTFMDAGSTGQKQMIAKWLEKDYWKVYEKKVKDKVNELKESIMRLEILIENSSATLDDTKITSNINIYKANIETLEYQIESLKKRLDGANNQLNKYGKKDEIEYQIGRYETYIGSSSKQLEEYILALKACYKEVPEAEKRKQYLEALPHLEDEYSEMKREYLKVFGDYNVLNRGTIEAETRLKDFRKQFNDIKRFDNICPVMKRPCTAIESIDGFKDEMVNKGQTMAKYVKELKEKTEKYKQLEQTRERELEFKLDFIKEIRTYRKYDTPETLAEKIYELDQLITNRQVELENAQSELEGYKEQFKEFEGVDINLLKSKKIELEDQLSVKNSELNDIIKDVAAEQAKLEHNQQMRLKAKEAAKEIKALQKTYNLYKYISFMFSKNGIPSNQVEVAFEELEQEANIILEKIQSDISIEFSAEKELATWEDNCLVCGYTFPKGFRKNTCPECDNERQKKRKDDLSIKIITKGNELDFNLESGGGKVLISLAIRLAFVRMLQRRLGVNLSLIVLDEVAGMLDDINRDLFIKLLTSTLINDLGFNQVFLISHEEVIRDVIPNVIKVTKYDTYSEFGWE